MESETSKRSKPGRGQLALWAISAALFAIGIVVVVLAATGSDEPTASFSGDVESPGPLIPREVVEPADGEDGSPSSGARLWSGDGHRLVQMRKGTSVRIHESPGGEVVKRVGDETEFGSPMTFSVLGRKGEWLKVTTPVSKDNSPLWIRANRNTMEFFSTAISIHADLDERIIEIRRDGEVERRFAVTIGAAGTSTPPGRWAITDVIVGGLNPVYGCCAIALSAHQDDLPEGWIGDDRVAIHGTVGPVGSASSNGCLRAPDEHAQALADTVPLGAPVFITS